MKLAVYYNDYKVFDLLNLRYNLVGADQLPDGRKVVYIEGDEEMEKAVKEFINSINN